MVNVVTSADARADESEWRAKANAAMEAAIPLAEKDKTRPVYHFRPPAQWMNDLCGAIYYKGYYHIFYQLNPFGDTWGSTGSSWGHARSKDLIRWEHLPIAIVPMAHRGELRCNSGCVTLDGHGRPMIFYTFVPARPDATRLGKREHWGAVPLDDGLIQWKRVKDEPLMAAGRDGVPEGVNAGWSDPFVFKADGRTFVTFKSCGGLVCESQNQELTEWKHVGRLDGVEGECPNFFPLQDKWVLIRSTLPISYIVGDFDARGIAFTKSGGRGILDYGYGRTSPSGRSTTRGLYGTNAFLDNKARRLLLGWVSGFKPRRGWDGCMSLPRILTLDDNSNLIQTPAPELEKLRGEHHAIGDLKLTGEEKRLDGVTGDTLEIVTEFEAGSAEAFGLKVRQSDDGRDAITIRHADGTLNIAGTEVPLKLEGDSQSLRLHLFLDKSVLELFINDGAASVTRVAYPGENDLGVSVFAERGSVTLKSLDAWEMTSVW
jgi:beta-fructofuranosidase